MMCCVSQCLSFCAFFLSYSDVYFVDWCPVYMWSDGWCEWTTCVFLSLVVIYGLCFVRWQSTSALCVCGYGKVLYLVIFFCCYKNIISCLMSSVWACSFFLAAMFFVGVLMSAYYILISFSSTVCYNVDVRHNGAIYAYNSYTCVCFHCGYSS
jgi:hypothetical protein